MQSSLNDVPPVKGSLPLSIYLGPSNPEASRQAHAGSSRVKSMHPGAERTPQKIAGLPFERTFWDSETSLAKKRAAWSRTRVLLGRRSVGTVDDGTFYHCHSLAVRLSPPTPIFPSSLREPCRNSPKRRDSVRTHQARRGLAANAQHGQIMTQRTCEAERREEKMPRTQRTVDASFWDFVRGETVCGVIRAIRAKQNSALAKDDVDVVYSARRKRCPI
ncbi:hypothetical protein EDB85DRAFT_1897013 [Lactarius pseudohatsudake]|nr:hypothetical protein EDB85DRAFT_1897013 [Lactarius pseudohatsudake]